MLYEIGRSLVVDGFRRIFMLNGHGGNHEIIQLVVRDLSLEYDMHAAAGSYRVVGWDGLVEGGAQIVPGHAGPRTFYERAAAFGAAQPRPNG